MRKPPRGPRAMTPDKIAGMNFDPSDPIQVAVKVTQLEGALVRSQEAFTNTAGDLSRGIEGLRADLRGVADQLKELPKLATNQDNQNSGLGRAFKAIEELAQQTRASFADRDEDLDAWKARYEAERDRWRTAHEDDNRKTREKMILWNGVAIGFSLLASTLVGAGLYIYSGDKTAARENAARIERTHAADVARLEATINGRADANAAAIREMERYLTQEGTVSGRPYVPSRTR